MRGYTRKRASREKYMIAAARKGKFVRVTPPRKKDPRAFIVFFCSYSGAIAARAFFFYLGCIISLHSINFVNRQTDSSCLPVRAVSTSRDARHIESLR